MSATSELERPTIEERKVEDRKAGKMASASPKPGRSIQQSEQTAVEQSTGKQEVTSPDGVERTRTARIFTPTVDIYETQDAVMIVADMPGVDESSVDVTLEKDVLTIEGHVEPNYPEGYVLAYSEYLVGDYRRSFKISNAIDWEQISGTVQNGVLKLTLPKCGPAEARKISIASEQAQSRK